jgi:hypothetical protein
MIKKMIPGLLLGIILNLSACNFPTKVVVVPNPTATETEIATATPTETPSPTATLLNTSTPALTASPTLAPTVTDTATITLTPTETPSPSTTPSPTITLTPTFDFPDIKVLQQAHCRYGPGSAYLHAADLYEGDLGQLWNRNYAGTWLWVQFDKIHYPCWVAASLAEVTGDIFSVVSYFPALPKSTLYGPIQHVAANRDGNYVTVTWDGVWMTEDDFRGFLIEANVCQNGFRIDVAYHSNKEQMTILDERKNCEGQSNGKLYGVEKHGYTDWVSIPWP